MGKRKRKNPLKNFNITTTCTASTNVTIPFSPSTWNGGVGNSRDWEGLVKQALPLNEEDEEEEEEFENENIEKNKGMEHIHILEGPPISGTEYLRRVRYVYSP